MVSDFPSLLAPRAGRCLSSGGHTSSPFELPADRLNNKQFNKDELSIGAEYLEKKKTVIKGIKHFY